MNIFKLFRNTSSGTKSVIGRSSLRPSPKFSLRQYGLAAVGLLVLAGGTLLFAANPRVAQACANTPNPSLGTDTQTVTIPTSGTYYLWSRLLAPDTTNNSYYLQVDGGCAIDVGDSANIPASSWTWVNYQDGSTSSVTSLSLTAGTHQVVMTGREPGVGVDRVLFLESSSCVPTGDGSNCTPAPDTTAPTVSLTTPAAGATVSGTTTIAATASDNGGGDALTSVQFKLDGANLGPADTTSPYSYAWNTTGASNGSHTLTAVATDAAGNTGSATTVTVTVGNGAPDTTPPSAPTGLTATPVSSSQINLAWTASNDNGGGDSITSYKLYRNGSSTALATVAAPSGSTVTYGDTGLSASTSYSYDVVAVDAAGNRSAASATVTATTQATTTGTVEGTVTNATTGKPIAGVYVHTGTRGTANGMATAYTNSTGQYVLTNLVTSYSHSYSFSASGYVSRSFGFKSPSGITTFNVALTPTPTPTTNLALNRPAYASSVESGSYGESSTNPVGAAVDGSLSTRWSSLDSDPQWIYVDLGSTYKITEVKLNWEVAYGKAYQIQVSSDAKTWTNIYSTTTGTGGVNDLTGLSGSGRYVRMYGTVRGTQWGYSLWEFSVYGTPN